MRAIEVAGEKVPVWFSARRGRLVYRLNTIVPEVGVPVDLRIELRTSRKPWRPAVYVTGVPECLRHRYTDKSLCMWWEGHANSRRWMLSDGLAALVHYVQAHLFQEACCRSGLPWPGDQAPGKHPRPHDCPTCGGVGP
jgi:hypothetical protein